MGTQLPPQHPRQVRAAGLLFLLMATAVVAYSQTRPAVKVLLSGSLDRGGKEVPLANAKGVKPGEILRWRIRSRNEGRVAALDYQTTAPIPKGTAYVADTAGGEGAPQVTFSVDGGRAYSARPMVPERQKDGTTKMIPAPASLYTHVRFQWPAALAAGASVNALYSTRVK